MREISRLNWEGSCGYGASWRPVGGSGIPGVVVECVDIGRNTSGEGGYPGAGPDAEARKRGERSGLDTRVVHAVNDGH